MIVKIDKSFVKDTDRIKDQYLLNRIANCINQAKNTDSIHSMASILQTPNRKRI